MTGVQTCALPILHPQTELAINTRVAVSDTHAMVSDIHHTIVKGQEGNDGRSLLASDTRTVFTAEYTLAAAHTETRPASSTTDGSGILYLYLVHLVNHFPRR